jgi:hypothetical protein
VVREHLGQSTERVIETDTVLTLLEESLQAAQDQGRASGSQELPSRVVMPGMYVRVGTLSNLSFH